MINNFNFSGKTIVITGASSGIGRQTAITLSKLGARIIAIARREDKLINTLSELDGEHHKYYLFDFEETEKIADLMKLIVDENGSLDALVYCAGVAPTRPINVSNVEFVENTMKINFFAFYEMVRQFVKRGRFNEGASIVSISSVSSVYVPKGLSVYGATKAAMDNSIVAIAKEIGDKGININTIRPRMVKTNMYEMFKSVREDAETFVNGKQPGGIIEPEEVAGMVAFLISPLAKHINGQHMFIG